MDRSPERGRVVSCVMALAAVLGIGIPQIALLGSEVFLFFLLTQIVATVGWKGSQRPEGRAAKYVFRFSRI